MENKKILRKPELAMTCILLKQLTEDKSQHLPMNFSHGSECDFGHHSQGNVLIKKIPHTGDKESLNRCG